MSTVRYTANPRKLPGIKQTRETYVSIIMKALPYDASSETGRQIISDLLQINAGTLFHLSRMADMARDRSSNPGKDLRIVETVMVYRPTTSGRQAGRKAVCPFCGKPTIAPIVNGQMADRPFKGQVTCQHYLGLATYNKFSIVAKFEEDADNG